MMLLARGKSPLISDSHKPRMGSDVTVCWLSAAVSVCLLDAGSVVVNCYETDNLIPEY